MVCSITIFIGAVISAAGSNQDSFALVVAGRVIMGFGSTVIETCTSKVSYLRKSRLVLCHDLTFAYRSWRIGSSTEASVLYTA